MNCTPASVPLPGVAVADTVTVADTVDAAAGEVIVALDVGPPPAVFSAVAKTSNVDEPSVHTMPIWPLALGFWLPVMKLRTWLPTLVPGTTAQDAHEPPLNFV